MQQTYFLRGAYQGRADRKTFYTLYPTGTAHFCPFCNEVWFLAPLDDMPTLITNLICDRHRPGLRAAAWSNFQKGFYTTGSLWSPHDTTWNENLPESLLRREFELTLKEYENDTTH